MTAEVNWNGKAIPQDVNIEDHPEGGANALNINRSVEIALLDVCYFLDSSTFGKTIHPVQILYA